jgi:uncharacterized protein (TIGR03546 family)
MSPFKLFRKLGKVLRGGVSNREMVLGVFFGFAVGMMPGFSLTTVIFLLLLLVLNCNTFLGILGIIGGKACCHLMAPVTYATGRFLIHQAGVDRLVRTLADTPVLAYLNWDNYCTLGGLPYAIVGGLLLGWLLATIITGFQRALLAGRQHSAIFRAITNFFLIRFVLRLIFGKQKKSLEETLEARPGLFSFGRIIVLLILVGLVALYSYKYRDAHLRRGLEKALGAINTAEVNIESLSLSLRTGRLVITGLQMTDPARPEYNQFQADELAFHLNVRELLRKRFVVSQILTDSVAMDVERETPGEVYLSEERIDELRTQLDEYLQRLRGLLDDLSGADLEQLERTYKRLQKLLEYLAERGSRTPDERADEDGYLSVSAQEVLTQHPAWMIETIELRNVVVMPEYDLPAFTIIGRNISSNPKLAGVGPSLEIPELADFANTLFERATGIRTDVVDDKVIGFFQEHADDLINR